MLITPQLPSPGPQPMSDQHQVVLGTSINGASDPMVGTPGAPIPSPLPALPFRPAHSAAQSLGVVDWGIEMGWLSLTHRSPSTLRGSPSLHWASPVKHQLLLALIHRHVHSLLTGIEGVLMHEGRILVSTPTEGAHDAVLEGVLARLQVGDGGSAHVHTCLGQGCHTRATPLPATTALHCQHPFHRPHVLLARLRCRAIALLLLIAALLCHAAALCLLGMPAAFLMVGRSWT